MSSRAAASCCRLWQHAKLKSALRRTRLIIKQPAANLPAMRKTHRQESWKWQEGQSENSSPAGGNGQRAYKCNAVTARQESARAKVCGQSLSVVRRDREFCVALKGVSVFTVVHRRAHRAKAISTLKLEIGECCIFSKSSRKTTRKNGFENQPFSSPRPARTK